MRKSLSRFRNRQFLDAAMAAAALVATADGDVTFSELSALDDLLETVQDLQVYDPHHAVEIYRSYADAILEDRDHGQREALKAASRVAGNGEAADLVLRLAMAISRADGDFSAVESRAIEDLSETLGLPPAES